MAEELNYFVLDCVQSFLLGIIQGFTEFFPISSSAQLKVVPYLLGFSDPGVSVSASLQLGSAFAIVFYFRKDIVQIINSFFDILIHRKICRNDNTKITTYIFIASIPILFFGLLVKVFWPGFSDSYFRSLFSIAIVSIIMAFLLGLSEKCGTKKKFLNDIKLRDIILLGFSQSLAIFPGVSRSGITLTSALFSGIERQTAARLTFLVGIPAVSISGIVEFLTIYNNSTFINIFPILIGIISSFISSIISIDFLLKFLARNSTFIFVYYRLAFGVLILSTL